MRSTRFCCRSYAFTSGIAASFSSNRLASGVPGVLIFRHDFVRLGHRRRERGLLLLGVFLRGDQAVDRLIELIDLFATGFLLVRGRRRRDGRLIERVSQPGERRIRRFFRPSCRAISRHTALAAVSRAASYAGRKAVELDPGPIELLDRLVVLILRRCSGSAE